MPIFNYFDDEYTVKLAEHHPSDALKLIKTQAKAHKIDWEKDLNYSTKKVTYVALKNLGRDQLAESFKIMPES